MLKKLKTKNGKIVQYSSLVYAVQVFDKEGNQELAVNVIHHHFDEVTFRNAFGHLDKETYQSLKEFVKSLGASKATYGRIDGSKKRLN